MNLQRGVILFSGFNQRAVFSFIRTLESCHVPYAVIAKSKKDTIFDSIYKRAVLVIRNNENLVLADILRCIDVVKDKMRLVDYLLAPTSEGLNRFFLLYRIQFESKNVIIPLVNISLYEKISDKYSFSLLCRKYNIKIPEEYINLTNVNIPFVAKPKKYFNEEGESLSPVLILNEQDLTDFRIKYKVDDFYYQTFISGESFYLLYYIDKDGQILKFSQQNIAQQPCGKSILAAIPANLHHESISLLYEKLLKAENFHGFIMIEVKKNGNEYFMIEANPRFWGPSQLFVDAGRNFFEIFLSDYDLLDKHKEFRLNIKNVKYFWYGGILQTLREKKNIVYHVSSMDIQKNISDWLFYDIYMREDTLSIFKNELSYD